MCWVGKCRKLPKRPLGVTTVLRPETAGDTLAQLLETKPSLSTSDNAQVVTEARTSLPRVLLVGLHTCGDLTPAMLRTFIKWPAVIGMVVVGCCYNLLTEANNRRSELAGKEGRQAAPPPGIVHVPYCPPAAVGSEGYPLSSVAEAEDLRLGKHVSA